MRSIALSFALCFCLSAAAAHCSLPANGEELFAHLESLDPRHIAGGWVVDLAQDPETGEAVALAEIVLRWLDGERGAAVVAGGAVLLRLSRDGVPYRDLYLGPEPAGPPCGGKECAGLPRLVSSERLTPEALRLGEGGEIALSYWRSSAEKPGRELLLHRLGADLAVPAEGSLVRVPTRLGPGNGSGTPPIGGPVIPPDTLVSIAPLPNTKLRGSLEALEAVDGNKVLLTQIELQKDFGMEAHFVTFEDPRRIEISFHAFCNAPGAALVLSLLDQQQQFQVVEVLERNCEEVDVRQLVHVENPSRFVHDGHDVYLHVEVIYGVSPKSGAPAKGRDAVDIDEMVIESEP